MKNGHLLIVQRISSKKTLKRKKEVNEDKNSSCIQAFYFIIDKWNVSKCKKTIQ